MCDDVLMATFILIQKYQKYAVTNVDIFLVNRMNGIVLLLLL